MLPPEVTAVNGRLAGFGSGAPFKSSDFNDLPQN
jgi:hypothetical protein